MDQKLIDLTELNISDDELAKMEENFADAQEEAAKQVFEQYGYEMHIQPFFVRGGGNYDYSAQEG